MLLNKVKTILSSPKLKSASALRVLNLWIPLFCQSGLFSFEERERGREGSEGASFAHRSHESLRAAAKDTRQTADQGLTDQRTDLSLKPNNHLS